MHSGGYPSVRPTQQWESAGDVFFLEKRLWANLLMKRESALAGLLSFIGQRTGKHQLTGNANAIAVEILSQVALSCGLATAPHVDVLLLKRCTPPPLRMACQKCRFTKFGKKCVEDATSNLMLDLRIMADAALSYVRGGT